MKSILIVSTLVAALTTAIAETATSMDRPGANIALGRPYTLDPAPNYAYCTGPGDDVQLTDGEYTDGYFWTQPGTVGWSHANPVIVTIDLGTDMPIRGASFNTAAGTANVTWPLAVFMFVASDDKQFHAVGDLVALNANHGIPAPNTYAVHRYWTGDLETHGRYIAFAFTAQPFAFVDEIEIYKGPPEFLNRPIEGDSFADVETYLRNLQVSGAIRRRLLLDIEAVRERAASEEISDITRQQVLETLEELQMETGARDIGPTDDFTTVLPLDTLHTQVFNALAKIWQSQGMPPLVSWQSGLWDTISHLADPQRDAPPHVKVFMMQNEFRAGAFNLTNTHDQPMDLRLTFTGLPGGTVPDYISVHEVLWTDTQAGIPLPSALPYAKRDGDAYIISIPSGLTRQIWFTCHPVELEPGDYSGAIEITGTDQQLQVPFTLNLYPIRFPDKPTLHFGGWDYTNSNGHRGVTLDNMHALIDHLRERFVDSPWATNAVIPRGEYDAAGVMTTQPDTTQFDEWIDRWPGARQYLIFAAVGHTFDRWQMGTPEFDTAVQAWVTFWAHHARKKGIEPQQMGWLMVDEPGDPESDATILAWSEPIRTAATGIRIWEDPVHANMDNANQEMIAACDVLCPNRPKFLAQGPAYRDYFEAQREAGKTLELYSCSGPSTLLDPYIYYRLQAWDCWRYGATASYFWAFGDTGGGTSWNEYAAPGVNYCPVFLGPDSVTPAKPMEAAREGIEDYEYLRMLKDAADRAEANSGNGAAIAQARALLEELPNRVLIGNNIPTQEWTEPSDRTIADEARKEILESLVKLQ